MTTNIPPAKATLKNEEGVWVDIQVKENKKAKFEEKQEISDNLNERGFNDLDIDTE